MLSKYTQDRGIVATMNQNENYSPRASLSNLAIPRFALPAPWKRNKFSWSGFPDTLKAAKMPATATDAVPMMSSLNVLYWKTNLY